MSAKNKKPEQQLVQSTLNQKVPLDTVIEFFKRHGIQAPEGSQLLGVEHYVNAQTGVVLFECVVQGPPVASPQLGGSNKPKDED